MAQASDSVKCEPVRFPLRVLTMNCFLRPWCVASSPPLQCCGGGDRKWWRAKRIARHMLMGCDVVCLQEAHVSNSPWTTRLVTDTMRLNGMKHYCVCPEPPLASVALADAGLVILSRLPILHHEFHPFHESRGYDSLASKGFLFAELDAGDGKRLGVLNCHVQSDYSQTGFEALSVQRSQWNQMGDFVASLPIELDVIVAGDLNADHNREWQYDGMISGLGRSGREVEDMHGDRSRPHPQTCGMEYDRLSGREAVWWTPLNRRVFQRRCCDYLLHLTGASRRWSCGMSEVIPCVTKGTDDDHAMASGGNNMTGPRRLSDHEAVACSMWPMT
jgi:endonuclease/exonuclease/phosphatase family metal-dependent hydrolase